MSDCPDSKKDACALVVPSLVAGGLERVASELANYLCERKGLDVYIISLANIEPFYELAEGVTFIKPGPKKKPAFSQAIRLISYVRGSIRTIRPIFVLSFGSKFNSFTLLSTLGLKTRIFVSDRSNPYRNSTFNSSADPYVVHDGFVHILAKWLLYRRAAGIIAQTEKAKVIDSKFLNHANIRVIPNPVKALGSAADIPRQNIILNVGRFTELKNQAFLVNAFHEIGNYNWKLVLLGKGPCQAPVKDLVERLGISSNVEFIDETRDIGSVYRMAKIFAFTSLSEGFPNALAEALGAPVASIAFDCVCGPSELIKHGEDGILINVGDDDSYIKGLAALMNDESLRARLEDQAVRKMRRFRPEVICEEYYKFLSGGEDE